VRDPRRTCLRALPGPLVRDLKAAGAFRALIPAAFGGLEAPFDAYLRTVEALAAADASTAWCVNQAAVFATSAAFMTDEAAGAIYADPRAAIANGPSPTATAERVDGGYRVSGYWNFSSGIGHATWLAAPARICKSRWS